MIDQIKILPDNIANQIAAGEVIQRPASVIKELVENAVDAKSENITVNVKDAGKTLIQIIDNGSGMSETDARIAFERHSTSKISTTEDLFNIHTKGFRGEALASIASIAQVELKTKRESDEMGTQIEISGSEFVEQKDVVCKTGSTFSVKNLFFNVPARRRFLKADATELRHIIKEFIRITISHTEVAFSLHHNNTPVYNLPKGNLKQRLIDLFGNNISKQLVKISTETSIVKIYGFIGKPELAKKKTGEQFFFVNNRFMKSAYFNKAISLAYSNLLPKDAKPSYFIFFEISPKLIDINIHPTKTEINFEDGNSIFQILLTSVKSVLSKHNVVPSIDFDNEGFVEVKNTKNDINIPQQPEIDIDLDYNPFNESKENKTYNYHEKISSYKEQSNDLENWDKAFEIIRNKQTDFIPETENLEANNSNILGVKSKYIVTTVKSGIMFIDQKLAHERILYDDFYLKIQTTFENSQQTLFPIKINFSAEELIIFDKIYVELLSIGFKFIKIDNNNFEITGIPTFLEVSKSSEIIENFIEQTKHYKFDIQAEIKEKIVISLAKSAAISHSRQLNNMEMRGLIDKLFASQSPNYTADGRLIVSIMKFDEIENRF